MAEAAREEEAEEEKEDVAVAVVEKESSPAVPALSPFVSLGR